MPIIVCAALAVIGLTNKPPMTHFEKNHEPTMAQVLMDTHGCWQGTAPADMTNQIPGHVVVQMNGTAVYSDALVSDAMQHIFNHKVVPFEVIAFCR